ncbi:MAG: TerB N-terminal domain-containing protein [Planctomycetaceae bacterium]|nr:TerB N-terminal domain-containing protein [Planctomycetaceae bacterium]
MGQLWHCLINGQEYGPFDAARLREIATHSKLRPTDHVRLSGAATWTVASKVKGLFPPPPAETRPLASVSRDRQWKVQLNGRTLGPYSDRQLKLFAMRGELKPHHLLQILGDPKWREARKIQGLFEAPTARSPAKAPPPQTPPVAGYKFACTACGRMLNCDAPLFGKTLPCPICKNLVTVPSLAIAASSTAATAIPLPRNPLADNEPVVIQSERTTESVAAPSNGLSIKRILGSIRLGGSASEKVDHRPSKESIEFYGASTVVDLGFGPLRAPLVYATAQRFGVTYDASLIELPLPATRSSVPPESLPYWPTYHEATPRQRGRYLDWLYGGRRDPSIELGYVFIFFYGLERRILIDGVDHAIVVDEILQLIASYTKSNSFRTYATSLLWLTVYLTADRGGLPEETVARVIQSTSRWNEDSLQYSLGYFGRLGIPLPNALAVAIASCDQRSINSVVVARHHDKFNTLFKSRLAAIHPNGFSLPAKHRERKIEYRPASGTLLAARNPPPEIASRTIPAYNPSLRHFASLATLWNECVDELKEFDRASRRDGSGAVTAEMYEALPPELRREEHPERSAWQRVIEFGLDESGWPVVKISQLSQIKNFPLRPQLTKKQCETLLATADSLKLSIEPDARLTGKNYRWDELVVVFQDDGPSHDAKALTQYRTAATLLQLSLAIAKADEVLDEGELGKIANHIERDLDLSPQLTKRLEGLKHLLVTSDKTETSVTQSIRKSLAVKERKVIGSFLVTVAASDRVICDKERKALKKAFRGLGIPADELTKLLAQHDALELATNSAPEVDEIDARQSDAPALSLERIRAIREETSRVQELLHAVLSSAEPEWDADDQPYPSDVATKLNDSKGAAVVAEVIEVDEPISAIFEASLLEQVPERYQAFFAKMATQSSWRRAELADLARANSLMLNAACEAINEWSTEAIGDWVIEEADDHILVHRHLLGLQ